MPKSVPSYFWIQQDELQISGDDIDFSGIDEDLEQFQQDDIVRQALLQGVDLRGYARDIDLELREVIGTHELFIYALILLDLANWPKFLRLTAF